jgi:hypothetical protein
MRPIYQIATEISRDWKNPYFGAVPYLRAMHTLRDTSSRHGADDARGIILYFLSNSGRWKGDTARRVKAELRTMLKVSP